MYKCCILLIYYFSFIFLMQLLYLSLAVWYRQLIILFFRFVKNYTCYDTLYRRDEIQGKSCENYNKVKPICTSLLL